MHAGTRCVYCDYDLGGLSGRERCPECGMNVVYSGNLRRPRDLDNHLARHCRLAAAFARGALWVQFWAAALPIVWLPLWPFIAYAFSSSRTNARGVLPWSIAVGGGLAILLALGLFATAGFHACRVKVRHQGMHPLTELGKALRGTPIIAIVLLPIIIGVIVAGGAMIPMFEVLALVMLALVVAAPSFAVVLWSSCLRRMMHGPDRRRWADSHLIPQTPIVLMYGTSFVMIVASLVSLLTPLRWLIMAVVLVWQVIVSAIALVEVNRALKELEAV